MTSVCVIGGGPGGLMTAMNIGEKLGPDAKVVLFEASSRLGGKILTGRFDQGPATYEVGVAEIYDYSAFGHDPLRNLIEGTLGLSVTPMDSEAVALDGRFVAGVEGMRARYGDATADAILAFRRRCTAMMSPSQYYEGSGTDDNRHPWAGLTLEALLDREVADPVAKRFLKVSARSDIASEPHLTNGLNGLKNILMDVDGYIDLYSVVGGNGLIVERLAALVQADIRLRHRVRTVGRSPDGRYRVTVQNGLATEAHDFDAVIVALPHNWLSTIAWTDESLRQAMVRHVAHFDRPAHYLRVTCLFDAPFWRPHMTGSWFMSEAFGGCCVYDEGARHETGGHGVLNWLVAGADVLAYGNLDPDDVVREAIATLPEEIRAEAAARLVEGRVHRWLASVNALPGGMPVRDSRTDHIPAPKEHPGVFVVGDYLFDSTLNGLLDSADAATDFLLSHLAASRYLSGRARSAVAAAAGVGLPAPSGRIDRAYFETYRGVGPYRDVWARFSDPDYMIAQVRRVYGLRGRFRILVAGSASGELVAALRERGVDAWGIESHRGIQGLSPDVIRPFNILGTVADLPFEDGSFDVVWETCLCHLGRSSVGDAIDEIFRVASVGVVFGSVTSDLKAEALDRHDLLRGVRTLGTWWEWSERFLEAGFHLALDNPARSAAAWAAAEAGPLSARWMRDEESFRHAFFSKPGRPSVLGQAGSLPSPGLAANGDAVPSDAAPPIRAPLRALT